MRKLKAVFLGLAFSLLALGSTPRLLQRGEHPLQAESDLSAFDSWETPIAGFFIRTHHEAPIVDEGHWELLIDGLVDKPVRLGPADLKRLPLRTFHAVLECSGNGRSYMVPTVPGVPWGRGAVGNAEWSGARFTDILALAKIHPKKEARFARVEGADKPALPTTPGFVRSIPLAKMLEEDTLLAWKMNREPMPVLHGGPLRLILPRWYGQNWIKWVTHITLQAEEDPGFYMKKGYRMPNGEAITELRVQSLIARPRPGAKVAPGDVTVEGKTFSGAGPIVKVELSTDEGKSWTPAALDRPHASGGWQEFRGTLTLPKAGTYAVLSRATDAAGKTQPLELEWNPSGYLRHGVDRVSFEVNAVAAEGAALVETKCQTCHGLPLVYGQSLPKELWEKSIKKMEGFGLQVSDEERTLLVTYLTSAAHGLSPGNTDYPAERRRYERPEEKSTPRGKKLYGANCAVCHGARGEGDKGPRLSGRIVPRETFYAVVREGRGNMPSFSPALRDGDIAAIRGFIQRP